MNTSTSLRRLSKFFRFITVFALIFVNLGGLFPPPNVLAQSSVEPIIVAFPFAKNVTGFRWPENTQVTLTIDDHSINGIGIDYSETGMVTALSVYFPMNGFTLKPGQILTMTDGTITKTHTVTSLTLGGGWPDNDTVWGTASPGSVVEVTLQRDFNILRRVTADDQGRWQADFSVSGNNTGEDALYDIQYGDGMMVIQKDEDNDQTQFDWRARMPSIVVFPEDDILFGDDWNWDRPVNITIDDPSTATNVDHSLSVMPGVRPWSSDGSWLEITLPDFDLKPGQVVTYTNGYQTKVHVIKNVHVMTVDPQHDTVSGTAEPGTQLNTWVQNVEGNIQRDATADESGNWAFDFSTRQNPWDILYDIVPGSSGFGKNFDEDGDATNFAWGASNPPTIVVRPLQDFVHGWSWPEGAWVTLTLDDPDTLKSPDYTESQQASHSAPWRPEDTLVSFINYAWDIQAGDIVTLTDGITTKTHITTNLTVDSMDVNADTVSGTAEPGSTISNVNVCDETGCSMRSVTADASGHWVTDFSTSEDVNHPGPIDIRPGTQGIAIQDDEDGDGTHIGWEVPNPSFAVWANDGWEDHLQGWGWPLGVTVSLTITRPGQPDYTDSATVGRDEGNPNGTWFRIDLDGYDLQPGDLVTVTDGHLIKQHIVQFMSITETDLVSDIAYGTATPNQLVSLWICDKEVCANRDETTDETGQWSANFGQPGDQESEQETVDLPPGAWIGASIRDEDNDRTMFSWRLPNPTFSARLTENEVHGYNWPLGSTVNLTIDDPSTPGAVDYADAQSVAVADWDPNQTFVRFRPGENGFTLKSGMIVSMSNGLIIKTHLVTDLTVTGVDPATDTVSGTAKPGSHVEVGHLDCDENGCRGYRRILADSTGSWIADFAHVGEDEDEQDIIDITPGMDKEARQCDEDEDCTQYGWRVPNPVISVSPDEELIEGSEWPLDKILTIQIGNSNQPDYTTTASVNPADQNHDWPWFKLDLKDIFDLQPGQLVTVFDGKTTKQTTVVSRNITSIDSTTDVITGTAEPNIMKVVLWICDGSNCAVRMKYTNPDGSWSASFATPGEQNWENVIFDLQAGTNGGFIQEDVDGDGTVYQQWLRNQAPIADAGPDQKIHLGDSVTLDASASADPDGDTLVYEWDLDNDGQYDDANGPIATSYFDQIGDHTIGLQVTDDAGLRATDTVTIVVLPWTISGFDQPVDMNGIYNLVKGGSTVPMKFEIFAGQNELTDVSLIKSFTYQEITCNAKAFIDNIELTVIGGTSLRYDMLSGHYIYNWKTPSTSGLCYRVTLITLDGNSLLAYFKTR